MKAIQTGRDGSDPDEKGRGREGGKYGGWTVVLALMNFGERNRQ